MIIHDNCIPVEFKWSSIIFCLIADKIFLKYLSWDKSSSVFILKKNCIVLSYFLLSLIIISRIGLCGFDNPMRDQKTDELKRHIGQVSTMIVFVAQLSLVFEL